LSSRATSRYPPGSFIKRWFKLIVGLSSLPHISSHRRMGSAEAKPITGASLAAVCDGFSRVLNPSYSSSLMDYVIVKESGEADEADESRHEE